MIEERARVIRITNDTAWVEVNRQSTCNSCSASQSCGTSLLSRFLNRRFEQIAVVAKADIQVGDEVILGLDESAFLRGSFVVYMIPLLAMLGLAALSEWLLSDIMSAESAAILGAVAGFIIGVNRVRAFSRRVLQDKRFQPVILRRLLKQKDQLLQ